MTPPPERVNPLLRRTSSRPCGVRLAGAFPLVVLVPGAGVEPARAEAHGILSPARLPVPPSRPAGRPRLPSRAAPTDPPTMRSHFLHPRTAAVLAVSIVVAVACGGGEGSEASAPRIAVLQDGSFPDARSVVSPAVLGLEIALEDVADVLVLDTDGTEGEEAALAVVADPAVVGAVIAPFTAMSQTAIDTLAGGGVPFVSLSSSAAMPPAGTPWRAITPPAPEEANALGESAAAVASAWPICLAGEGSTWSEDLRALIARSVPSAIPLGVMTDPGGRRRRAPWVRRDRLDRCRSRRGGAAGRDGAGGPAARRQLGAHRRLPRSARPARGPPARLLPVRRSSRPRRPPRRKASSTTTSRPRVSTRDRSPRRRTTWDRSWRGCCRRRGNALASLLVSTRRSRSRASRGRIDGISVATCSAPPCVCIGRRVFAGSQTLWREDEPRGTAERLPSGGRKDRQ